MRELRHDVHHGRQRPEAHGRAPGQPQGEYCHRVDDVIGSEIGSQSRDCTDIILSAQARYVIRIHSLIPLRTDLSLY